MVIIKRVLISLAISANPPSIFLSTFVCEAWNAYTVYQDDQEYHDDDQRHKINIYFIVYFLRESVKR